jgi:CheY-like chemotaxis protein
VRLGFPEAKAAPANRCGGARRLGKNLRSRSLRRFSSSSFRFTAGLFGDSADKEREGSCTTKILLVDDRKFLRLAAERALARAGYEVYTATDGERALRMVREKMPDLILLDMLLPKMPGPDVLTALQNDPATAHIAVVVLTGLSHKNAVRLQPDGACAFLEKSGWHWTKVAMRCWRHWRRLSGSSSWKFPLAPAAAN